MSGRMKSVRQRPTVRTETHRQRPDVDPLACGHAECPWFRQAGANTPVIRKVDGHDRLRLRRCRSCGEELPERRGTALCPTTLPEARAEEVSNHLGEGGRVRATARLVPGAQATGARLWRVTGRHAARCHAPHGHGLTPRALALDAQGSCVKKNRSAAATMRRRRLVTCGIRPPSRRRVRWWSPSLWANGRTSNPQPWCTIPSDVSGRGLCPCSSPMPTRAMRPPSSQPLAGGIRLLLQAPAVRRGVPACAGPKAGPRGR